MNEIEEQLAYNLAHAIRFAADFHADQLDKAGMPYILHPLRVMEAMGNHGGFPNEILIARMVGVLHDVVEDTPATLETIRELFGDFVHDEVDAITKRKGQESYREYLDRIRARLGYGGIAIRVKLEDMKDNTRPERLAHLSVEKQVRLAAKYARGRHYLLTGEWYDTPELDSVIEAGYKK